ncbi:aminotransferase class V-fold PLP-dependent enzyme [Croceitalea rosinachiae]|uniref:Aminotransferase class V-fold PLP-dependent enzyme n=1 Tax=Croceitalea rosinachiae TaxID=3075596 RepID=A0ABU3A5Z0_9FLAO|nr:aminotransferase class V-fold PLP-dependent enzyme [Croceitalea sp. F388]MDT0605591.1 aminotransferase class V-fold PLP-dependent enzyme [Croceitalea sp. F388]
MKEIRKKFPVLQQHIYANTAATGLLSEDLLEWRQEHDLDYLIGGSMMKMNSNKMHSQTRKVVGDFFNCPADNVALVPNFTIGLNFLLEGLDKREKILLLNGDYPSLNRPFESRGFEIITLDMTSDVEERIYQTIKNKSITVIAISVIQWLNGIKVDLEFLKKLKSEFPDLLIITDGTQFLGTSNFDFSSCAIDIIGASAYKWLLAGFGSGFLLIKEGVEERFSLVSDGYGSGRNNRENRHKRTFCKHLEPGHLDSLNFGSLEFSLNFLNQMGMKNIEEKLVALSIKAKETFTELGLLEEPVVRREVHSTIFNIKANQAVFDKLLQENIIMAQRGDGIRLSFHFYNTFDEVDAIVKILKKMN